jgi:hypothetical protein
MAPQFGKNMPNKPKKVVKINKHLSKERKEKTRMLMKMNARKRKVLKEVPELLKYLDNGCLNNLQEWLNNLPHELTRMSQNKVNFGSTVLKFGMLDASLSEPIRQRLTQLKEERKTPEQTAKAQGSEAGILPPHTPSVNSNLLLPKKYQSITEWKTLFIFLRDGSFEKMGVKLVDQALRLLELGFAKSVDPTMNQESTMQGDLHGSIRDKLLKQQALAKAKNEEKAEKKKLVQKKLEENKNNLGCEITWTKDCRPVDYPGLVVSPDPRVIYAPFSLSEQELEDLIDEAKKDAIETSLPGMHESVLKLYTSQHYKPLNTVLRTPGNEAEFKKYAHYLVHLTNALSLLEKLPQDENTVHRGTACFKLEIQADDLIVFPAPTSASKSMRIAHGFTGSNGNHFVIKVLTGKSIEKFSFFPDEKEVLLPPNSYFKVEKITRDKDEMAKVLLNLTGDNIENIDTMVVLVQYA